MRNPVHMGETVCGRRIKMNLPDFCYSVGRSGQITKIYRGEHCAFGVKTREGIDKLNRSICVNDQQVAAMRGGLYHGWDSPLLCRTTTPRTGCL